MFKEKKCARDNRANQLNPNNSAYYRSRGIHQYDALPGTGSGKRNPKVVQPTDGSFVGNKSVSKVAQKTGGNLASNRQQRRSSVTV